MNVLYRLFPALVGQVVWLAVFGLNDGHAGNLLPNPFFEETDDFLQPLHWEFHPDRALDLISIAHCSDSPVGDSVLRITGMPVPAEDSEPVLARVDTDFIWDPGVERLSLQCHYRRVSSGTEILPVRLRLEIQQEPDPVEMVVFPDPVGFQASDTNTWHHAETWTAIISADTLLEEPVNVVGLQIQRSTAYLPEDTKFFLGGLILTLQPVDVAAAIPDGYPAVGDDLSVEMPLLDWQPGMEIILGEGGEQQLASDVIEVTPGILAIFESVTLSPGWQPLTIATGGDPLMGGSIPIYPAAWLDGIEPSNGSSQTPTEIMIHGAGFVHGMTGQLGGETFPLRIASPVAARATIPPQPPATAVLQAALPWDRIVEGEVIFTYVRAHSRFVAHPNASIGAEFASITSVFHRPAL